MGATGAVGPGCVVEAVGSCPEGTRGGAAEIAVGVAGVVRLDGVGPVDVVAAGVDGEGGCRVVVAVGAVVAPAPVAADVAVVVAPADTAPEGAAVGVGDALVAAERGASDGEGARR